MADEELRKIFAQRLNYYLEQGGYNQADMARRMKVSTATTAKWCTGQTMPRVDKIQSLCNWLGISKADLLEADLNIRGRYDVRSIELSHEEEQLIRKYRTLSEAEKDMVCKMLDVQRKDARVLRA